MSRHIFLGIGLLAGMLTLGGCGNRDPYQRTDVWRPTGANAANIAAMAVNPNDLISGRGVKRYDTRTSEPAVERLWMNRGGSLSGGAAASSGGASGGSPGGGSPGGASAGGEATPGS